MTKPKYTRGKWRAAGSMIELEDDTKPDIGTTETAAFDQAHLPRPQTEIFANAWLMAAAPDMHEFIKRVATDLGGYSNCLAADVCKEARDLLELINAE